MGLSPRVRGNPSYSPCLASLSRSIPACTGEPEEATNKFISEEVYPRVYGGTINRINLTIASWGLSPRVRGNLLRVKERHALSRSIPACTGEPAAGPHGQT